MQRTFKPLEPLRGWRRLAAQAWRSPQDPSTYAVLEIPVRSALTYLERVREETDATNERIATLERELRRCDGRLASLRQTRLDLGTRVEDLEKRRGELIEMVNDPEGRRILEAGADLLKSSGDLGFVAADDRDYDNYRKFYRTTQVK